MNDRYKYLLCLAGCGARGAKAPAPSEDIDWQRLISEAYDLQLASFVAGAVKKTAGLSCPEEVKERMAGGITKQGIQYYYGRKKVIKLQEELREAGIPSAVMKGYALSCAYAVPQLRMGHDVDLHVQPSLERDALSWLKSHGWTVTHKRDWCKHHTELYREGFGTLELHTSLHPRNAGIYFGNRKSDRRIWELTEPYYEIETEDGPLCTLGIEDHFIFLCVHMIRHILETEMTMRMVLDTAAYTAAYRDQIDWGRVWRTMRELRCEKLFCTVLRAAETYFGYSFGLRLPLDVTPSDQEKLMDNFCNTSYCSPDECIRIKYEYNSAACKSSLEFLRYRWFILMGYSDSLASALKKYGVWAGARRGLRRISEILLGRYDSPQDMDKVGKARSDEALSFLQDMGMM